LLDLPTIFSKLTILNVLFAIAIAPLVFCHSWLEQLTRFDHSCSMNPGYAQGTMPRLQADFTEGIIQSLLRSNNALHTPIPYIEGPSRLRVDSSLPRE
jgi:hypothetical protein